MRQLPTATPWTDSTTIANMSLKRPHSEVNGSVPPAAANRLSNAALRQQKRKLWEERFRHNRELPLNMILMITAHVR